MKYFEVEAKCGHVKRNNYIIKTFAIQAESKKEAAKIARKLPRVKHHAKDAICSVKEIDETRYHEIIERNHKDKYFSCKSVQEQRRTCDLDDQIYREDRPEPIKKTKSFKHMKLNELLIRESRRMIFEYQYQGY